jgi:hypothetical protein
MAEKMVDDGCTVGEADGLRVGCKDGSIVG